MPHANGVIYSTTDSNGNKIGINTDDVNAVIGVASHDVATLCLSTKVNKWNKNKPYRGTQPEVKSRTVDNAANETGKYLGSRGSGTTTGFPCYWGMRYPMNTAQQNASGNPRSNLLELCYDVARPTTSGHPNYEYMKPVVGTDFCRLDDFDGYYHNAGPFLDAGVTGAVPGNGIPATIKISKYDSNKLTVYAIIPSDSYGFVFPDIIPEADSYYLVAEFYRTDMWVSKSNAVPAKTVKSSVSLAQATGMSISFDVSISEILSALGLSTTVDVSFYICVGFNKYSGSGTAAGSAAFIAPWKSSAQKCATLVTVQQGSPWYITIQQYALNPTAPSSYKNFPTSEEDLKSNSTLFFKTLFQNNGANAVTIYTEGGPANSLMFRAFAVGGNYDNPDYLIGGDGNQGHMEAGGSGTMGARRALKVGTEYNVSSTVNNVTIPAKSSMTLYFKAESLIPKGNTSMIMFEVSNDGGASWAQTGDVTARFYRD